MGLYLHTNLLKTLNFISLDNLSCITELSLRKFLSAKAYAKYNALVKM